MNAINICRSSSYGATYTRSAGPQVRVDLGDGLGIVSEENGVNPDGARPFVILALGYGLKFWS